MFILIGFAFIFISCIRNNVDAKKINIDMVVKEAFITDKGYSDELSKHISKDVFDKINVYNVYAVNNPQYIKHYNVDFTLNENSQEAKKDTIHVNDNFSIIIVNLNYSVNITDSQGKIIGGSSNVPITFIVKNTENNWCIIDKYEAA